MFAHDDLVRGEGDEGAAGHRVMRDERRDGGLAPGDGLRDLQRGQRQSPRRVQDQVDGNVRVGLEDGADDLLRVLHVEEAHQVESEEAHALLAMHQQDHAASALAFDATAEPPTRRFEQAPLRDGLQQDHAGQGPGQEVEVHGGTAARLDRGGGGGVRGRPAETTRVFPS